MTGTPIKDFGVGGILTNAAAPSKKVSGAGAGFEAVWNRQTDTSSRAPEEASEGKKTVSQKDNVAAGDSLKEKDIRQSRVKGKEVSEEKLPEDLKDMDPEEWKAAMEVLGTAAAELIMQIAENFGMEPQDVQDLMTDLGMEQMDILQPENLGQLLLAAAGAEDETVLLTDGELYQQYRTLMEQRELLMNQSSETLQTDAEQLLDLAVEQPKTVTEEAPLPIEVTVENEAVDTIQEDGENETVKPESKGPVDNMEQEANIGRPKTEEASKQQDSGTKQHQESAHDKGENSNLVLQNLRTDAFKPQTESLSQVSSAWDVDTQNIMKQIMDYMKIQLKPDMSDLEMQLHPANLGTLQIHVSSKAGVITAEFVTQNESVKAALESQMIQLKESFAEQGVKVEAIEVAVQTHQFEQNLEQGKGGQQGETDKRSRTRRIHLDGPLTMEELEGMEEEEQLSAQMMAANGNTVDFTA